MIILNKNSFRDPRTVPWGRPQFMAARPESYPFMEAYWLELDRYDTNHFKLHKSHFSSILPTISGSLQYQKIFLSPQN